MRIFLIIAGLMLLSQPAFATAQQDIPTQPTDESVVVTAPAQQVMDAARAFVGEVAVEGTTTDQIGRWDGTICPGVVGMREDHAGLLLDRIAVVAYAVGLNVGEPGCRANLMIFVTSDSDALARYIAEEHTVWVTPRGAGCFAYTNAVRDFVETPRPVRWWHVSYARSRYGALAERRCNEDEAPGVEAPFGRIGRSTRQEFGRALVIVDARRIAGHHFGAIADYIAMVSLASMDATADTAGFETILNLFTEAGAQGMTTLTDWDVGYLEGLYGARQNASGRTQRNQMARAIARGVTGETPPGAQAPRAN